MATFKREDLRRVFFSDLSEQCDEDIIHELCTQFGPIANITWPSIGNLAGSAQHKTFCFVDFINAEDAKYCYEALYRSRVRLFGKELRVSHASTDISIKESGSQVHNRHAVHELHEIGAKVVVRGVDLNVTEYDLTSFFGQFGKFAVPPRKVRDVEGNFRGVVILSYEDFAFSDKVIDEMDQKVYRDRPISVAYAMMEDGSGRQHGTPEERENAKLFLEEARKHAERIAKEQAEHEREKARRRRENVSWASGIDPFARGQQMARGQAGRNCGGGVLESRQQWRAQGIGPKEAATRASAHFMLRTSDAHLADAREDRLQRALQENRQLKHELQELREKLKVVQVKFYKLTKDLKRVSPEMLQQLDGITATTLPTLRPASSGDIRAHSLRLPGAKKSTRRGFATSLPHVDAIKTEPTHAEMESKELQHCREALQQAQLEIASLRAGAPQTTALAENTTCTVTPVLPSALPPAVCLVLDQLRQDIARVTAERDQVSAECNALREQFARTRAEFESAHLLQRQQRSFEKHSFDVLNERAATAESARHHSELEYQKIIDALTREKDALALKLRLSEQENSERLKELSSVDPTVLIQLQNEAHDKSKQITVLTSRMQWAQQQAETLKSECSRLVEELKRFQSIHSETKKQLFEAEHDKSLLQVRCARLEELEATLRRKSEELIHMEQELLRTTGTLQSCNQETEEAVRRELSSRIADLQEMRDNAELRRREKESQLLSAQHQLAELRRQLELARGDAAMYREQLQKAEMERSELTTRAALAGRAVEDLGDEHVQRALTVAAMRRTSSRRLGEAGEAEEALDMWDALKWDENWEADQLREALASAALDMELANTRCSQMSTQIEQSRSLLQQISQERDALLDENIEMRRRLSHVQTVFAKQQLEAYCASKARGVDSAHARSGLISFHIQDVECDEVLLRSLGIGEAAGAAVNFFFTLDGLRSYDTMLSPTFYSLYEPLDIRFRYDHLDRDEVTVDAIRNTTFVFQLHQVKGTTNKIVAMAEVPGVALLSCRELTVSERIQMLNGDGEPAGAITVEMCASHLMLPVLLDRPLGSTLFTADALRAVLLSLRSVVALRVQVFRANGLLGTPVPQPYVFYTTSAPVGLSCVRDTVVRPSSKPFTTDPVFDADPVDHRLVVDRELVEFIAGGAVVFILFDEQAKDVQANLGVAEVPLRALLESPQAVVRTTEALHPQGTISVGLSWVCRA